MSDDLAAHYEHCGALLREQDRDRWLACLFAPEAKRKHLHALYAFNLEVGKVREIVSDPMPGEIRFQWWRDALEGEARGDVRAHPVAAALIDTIRTFMLPRKALTDLIEARTFDLYDDPMPTISALEGYCGETSSVLMRLAALILGDGEPGGADGPGHGGVAYAITGLLRAFPWHSARGQVYVPIEILGRHGLSRENLVYGKTSERLRGALAETRLLARQHLVQALEAAASMPSAARVALLPLYVCPLYLGRMDRRSYDPYETIVDAPQWRRQWALWKGRRALG